MANVFSGVQVRPREVLIRCSKTGDLVAEEDCGGICAHCDLNENLLYKKERRVADECRTDKDG